MRYDVPNSGLRPLAIQIAWAVLVLGLAFAAAWSWKYQHSAQFEVDKLAADDARSWAGGSLRRDGATLSATCGGFAFRSRALQNGVRAVRIRVGESERAYAVRVADGAFDLPIAVVAAIVQGRGPTLVDAGAARVSFDTSEATARVVASPCRTIPAGRRMVAMRQFQAAIDPAQPRGAVLFLGDSLTVELPTDSVATPAVNYGIWGQTSADLLRSMQSYGSMKRARLVVVTIGTNDVLQGRSAGIEARLSQVLDAVPGPVILNVIPPTTGGDAAATNRAIRNACATHANCALVDAGFVAGDLREDGVHLKEDAYGRWVAKLRQRM